MQVVHEHRGARRKPWRILVTPIPPERYPAFQHDPEHAFASMAPEKRIAEVDAVCARLWSAKDVSITILPSAEKRRAGVAA